MDIIEMKIKIWIEMWEDLINNFLKRSFGLSLYSPHILIDDIISEIQENGFKSVDNRNYFYSKLTYYVKSDTILQKELFSEFKILRQIFNTNRTRYILESSFKIKSYFQNGFYFNKSLEHLSNLLLSEGEISSEFIKELNEISQNLIIELLKKSYSLEDIKKFPKNIFDNYFIDIQDGSEFLITQFPHEIDSQNYYNETGVFEYNRYQCDIIKLISNLTNQERLNKLSYYYFKQREKAYYIFVIEGLKGDVEIKIGDVIFYSLQKKRFVKNFQYETFEDLQPNNKEKFLQAAVQVEFLLPESSFQEAISKLEKSLDYLSCYFDSKTHFDIKNHAYIVVNSEGQFISASIGRNHLETIFKYQNSLNLNAIENYIKEIPNYKILWGNIYFKDKSISKISNALHWYRKGEESIRHEDKLLNYWISIENILNKETGLMIDILKDSNRKPFHLIQETIASVQIFEYIYKVGFELYDHYRFKVNSNNLPNELINRAQLKPELNETIFLKNFIDNLKEVKTYETNLLILEKINLVIDFYEGSQKTKQIVEEQLKQIKNEVLLIYRFRNLIVHNAFFDNSLLPFWVWRIREFSKNLIHRIIELYEVEKDIADIIIDFHFKREKFLHDFEKGKVNIFDY